MAPSDPFGLVGQVLDGQFRVDRAIGEGGFSIVYQGLHVGLGEPIAIKCLKLPSALGSAVVESFVWRFRDESRIHYKLSQGNLHIVRSMASGTTLAPATNALVPYTVLEWLDGISLAQDFHDRRIAGQHGRPLKDVVSLLDSAVDALAFAHAQGVIHRDLNPGNFFLARTPAGTKVKILDFGVAKVMADAAIAMGPTAQTVGNMRMFAPAYGAPEQFDDRLGAVGPWTDVYAIALVVLEALTDRTVMDGEHLGEFAAKALDEDHRPTPRALGVAVGDATETLFAQAVALDPKVRPRDAGEFWGMLKNATQVDARSGRLPHAELRTADDVPTTLRVAPGMLKGTVMRLDRAMPRSASEVLAATPAPPRAFGQPPAPAGSPAPARVSVPAGLGSTLHMPSAPPMPGRVTPTPAPGTPTPVPAAPTPAHAAPTPAHAEPTPGTPTPVPADLELPRWTNPDVDAPPSREFPASSAPSSSPPGHSPALVIVLVLVTCLAVAGGAGLIWHAVSARAPVPAAPP